MIALCFGSRPSEQRGWRLLCVSSGEPEPGASKAVRRCRSAGVLEATPIPHVGCALRGFFFASYLGLLYFIMAGSLAKSYLMLREVLSCAWEQRGLLGRGWHRELCPFCSSCCHEGSVQDSPQSCRQHLLKGTSPRLASDSPDCLIDTFPPSFPPYFCLLCFSSIRAFVVC